MISKLPRDLVEEVLSRVPLKSMRSEVRSTCKECHSLSRDQSFVNKHTGQTAASARERQFVMINDDCRVYLIGVNLYEIHNNNNNFHISINRKGILINRENSNQVSNISRVFHCDGLLLCVLKNGNSRLMVWNPYCGKRRLITRRKDESRLERYALGYDKSWGSHKILRFYRSDLEIYDLSSSSWRVFNI